MANEISKKLTAHSLEAYYETLSDENNLKEFLKCAEDVTYFISNYYHIVSLDKGLIKFDMRDWQRDVCQQMVENRFSMAVIARQSGKTTLVSAILLWVALFNNNQSIAIIANKWNRAKEVIQKIDIAYTYLPDFLKIPLTTRNKSELVFINETRIKAYATSPDSLRGDSISMLYIDELAFFPKHVEKEFMQSTYPTISSSVSAKIMITSTPNGIGNEFYRLYKDSLAKQNGFKTAVYDYRCVKEHDNEEFRKNAIAEMGSEERFKVEYECQFLTSTTSAFNYSVLKLIDSKLSAVKREMYLKSIGLSIYDESFKACLTDQQIFATKQEGAEMFAQAFDYKDQYLKLAENKQNRLITIDCAEGLGGDYSVAHFLKFDFEKRRIVQEAILRSNTLSIDKFAGYVFGIGQSLGFPFLIFENNNKAGGEFKKTIVEQYRYPNIYYDKAKKDYGVYTQKLNKRLGVQTFKTLIEAEIFDIRDYDTFLELNYFEEYPTGSGKFQAQEGYTDDCIMALVIFSSVYQKFKDLFALLFGRGAVIDYMMNPALEAQIENLPESTPEETLEKMLDQRINDKKKEEYGDYDWQIEILKEMNIDLVKLRDHKVNTSIFKTNSGSNNSEDSYKPRNIFF